MDGTWIWKALGAGVYMSILLGIGIVASRRMRDMRDYFAAGKNLGFWAVAFSARATGESAWLLLGLTGMGAALGVRGFWVVLGEVLGVCGAWMLMSRRFKRLTDRYDAITVPDYLEARFGDRSRRLRVAAAVALTVFVTIYVSAQIDATGKAFETFLGMNYFAGALLGFAVVMAYATSGGFVAVVWSDIFQGLLMFCGLVALPLVGLYHMGGWNPVVDQLHTIDPNLLSWAGPEGWTATTIASTLGLCLIGLGFMGSPQIFVRFLALRDEAEIPKGTLVAFVWTLLADAGAVLIGMVGRAYLTSPGMDVNQILGHGAEDVLPQLTEAILPPLFVGLMIAIVLSAIMSTVDSLLVLASSAAVRDLYQQVFNPHLRDDELVAMSRRTTFALALFALGVAMAAAVLAEGRTVFWFVIFGWSGIAATFCPTMILSLFWRRMSATGALAAMITGFVSVPFFKFAAPSLPGVGPFLAALTELPPSFVASGVAGVVFSLLYPADPATQRAADADLDFAAGQDPHIETDPSTPRIAANG